MEMNPEILVIEDSQVSQTMRRALVKRGVDIITGISGIESVEKTEDGYYLTYTQGDQTQLIKCQAVILASGWPGNADELNPQIAGVETYRGYVVVDDHLKTTADHIFAAGDITGRMMLVQSAGLEARIAAENAVLTPGQRSSHHIVPHGGFTDPEYASVGITEAKARESGQEILVATTQYAEIDRAVIDGITEGFFKLIVSQENHRILGAHAVGEQAVEIIQIIAASIAADMWVEQLAEMEFSYPTYTAIVGVTARKAVYAMGVMPLAPQWRNLGRSVAAEWERGEGS
jgi:pyruvate/2-oxoglutarate dehydrogenase complex dihydrolipoamide dehydrogenase (E3) component